MLLRYTTILLTGLLALLLLGCQEQESIQAENAFIEANQSYRDHFGEPPTPKQGQAYARVAYLPLRNEPQRLRAVPLFLFSKQEQPRQVLGRLSSGKISLPENSDLYLPFPEDLNVMVGAVQNRLLELQLTTVQNWPTRDLIAALRSLQETALQFADFDQVNFVLNKQPLAQETQAELRQNPAKLSAVKSPSLLMVAGMVEEGEVGPEEIVVNFDRPIKVNSFHLADSTGEKVVGEYFTSIFDMAVVVHPASPERYLEEGKLRVEWDVTDALGRTGRGVNTLPLQYLQH